MKKFYIILVALFLVNGAFGHWIPQNSGTVNTLNSVYFTDANTEYVVGVINPRAYPTISTKPKESRLNDNFNNKI